MQLIKNLSELAENYDGFLFDAYGVLFDGKGLIPGAASAWTQLRAKGKPCWILTNGSSRTLKETVEHYQQHGMRILEDEVINSGSLLAAYFAEKNLKGQNCAVLGTTGSRSYVLEAGGKPVDPLVTDNYSVVIVANQSEYPLLDTVDVVLSRVITAVEQNQPMALILTNPDLIYPHPQRRFGITAGSVALLLEAALRARLGTEAPVFEKLGKPFPRIFEEAIRRAGSRRLLMIGDQVETDIRGASSIGLDSVLVGTGLVRTEFWKPGAGEPEPSYLLHAWKEEK